MSSSRLQHANQTRVASPLVPSPVVKQRRVAAAVEDDAVPIVEDVDDIDGAAGDDMAVDRESDGGPRITEFEEEEETVNDVFVLQPNMLADETHDDEPNNDEPVDDEQNDDEQNDDELDDDEPNDDEPIVSPTKRSPKRAQDKKARTRQDRTPSPGGISVSPDPAVDLLLPDGLEVGSWQGDSRTKLMEIRSSPCTNCAKKGIVCEQPNNRSFKCMHCQKRKTTTCSWHEGIFY